MDAIAEVLGARFQDLFCPFTELRHVRFRANSLGKRARRLILAKNSHGARGFKFSRRGAG
jgi:hypothetical protein